jgi:hypothetical protein
MIITDLNFFLHQNKRRNANFFKKVKAKNLSPTRNAMVKFKNDNNREYISYAFKEFLAKTKIKCETNTPSYYSKQNYKVI